MAWTKHGAIFLRLLSGHGLLLLCGLLFGGCSESTSDEALSPQSTIRILLDYYPEASHGGLYQAQLKGFYVQAGIAQPVEILPGGTGVYPLQQVALGKAEFAIGRLDDVVRGIEQGLPLRAVVATYQRDPQALMFRPNQGIKDFADLDGRKVMALPGAGFILWLEHKYGISMELIPLNYDISQFVADEQLVQQCYVTSQPFYLKKKGVDVETLLLADAGFDPIRVLYVNAKFSEKNPDTVRQMRQAVLRGITDYLEGDRRETDQRLLELNPVNVKELNDFTVEAIKKHKLARGSKEFGESLGLIDPERTSRLISVLLEMGMIEDAVTYEAIVDPSVTAL